MKKENQICLTSFVISGAVYSLVNIASNNGCICIWIICIIYTFIYLFTLVIDYLADMHAKKTFSWK
jgi:hypothetical protein